MMKTHAVVTAFVLLRCSDFLDLDHYVILTVD